MTKLDEAAAQFRECRDRNEELQSRRRAAEEAAAMAEREVQKLSRCGSTSSWRDAKDRWYRAKQQVREITAEVRTTEKTMRQAQQHFMKLNGAG
jgi:hypothetical protein